MDSGVVIDSGPVAYRQLPDAGDPTLEADLQDAWFGGHELATVRFRLVCVPLERFHIPDPESYLLDGDEAGYELVLALADAYQAGQPVPGIVAVDRGQHHEPIDGWHRLAGAKHAGRDTIEVYEPLPTR